MIPESPLFHLSVQILSSYCRNQYQGKLLLSLLFPAASIPEDDENASFQMQASLFQKQRTVLHCLKSPLAHSVLPEAAVSSVLESHVLLPHL